MTKFEVDFVSWSNGKSCVLLQDIEPKPFSEIDFIVSASGQLSATASIAESCIEYHVLMI